MVNVLPGSEIVGVHSDRGPWRLSSSILLALIIAAIAIGILLFIYNIKIVNYLRTEREYRITRGMVITATWLNYIAALLIGVTLVAAAIYVSYVGFPRFRHHPRGYTLSEHHEMMQGYMDVKASNMPEQVDVDRLTTDNREDNVISQLGGAPNVGVDLPDAYAGLPSLDGQSSLIPPRSQIIGSPISQPVRYQPSGNVVYDNVTGTYIIADAASPQLNLSPILNAQSSPILNAQASPVQTSPTIMGEESVLEFIERS